MRSITFDLFQFLKSAFHHLSNGMRLFLCIHTHFLLFSIQLTYRLPCLVLLRLQGLQFLFNSLGRNGYTHLVSADPHVTQQRMRDAQCIGLACCFQNLPLGTDSGVVGIFLRRFHSCTSRRAIPIRHLTHLPSKIIPSMFTVCLLRVLLLYRTGI